MRDGLCVIVAYDDQFLSNRLFFIQLIKNDKQFKKRINANVYTIPVLKNSKKKKKKEIGNICFSSQESKYFSSNIRQYIFNYILTCLSIYYPSHVIKIILKNLFIFIRCLIVARNSLNFLFILFYIPRDRLRIFISIRSLDRWKARFFGADPQGRDISRYNDYLVQVGCFAGRFFISLRRSPQKIDPLFLPSSRNSARFHAARTVQPRQYLRYSILFLKTEQRRHFKITMPATPPCIKDFSPCTKYLWKQRE